MPNCSPPSVTLRPWTVEDAKFVSDLRNQKKLQRWFRQNESITLEAQEAFIRNDGGRYNGQIIELDGVPIGVVAVKGSGELSLVLPTNHYNLLGKILPNTDMWGEVLIGNPLLKALIMNDFEIIDVREEAYYKKGLGYQDIVKIERDYKMGVSDAVSNKENRSPKVC